MRLAFCAVALCALACLPVRAGRLGMAGDYIDPFSHIGGQDEALYAHSAIQMAQHGGWLTPVFMGRYGLYKPPMLAALAGMSARIFGISRLALRLPSALLAALAMGLVFWWAAEIGGWKAGACAVLLLASNHLWHTLASMCLTDGLLVAFYIAALYCLFADPWLERRWTFWGYAGAVAASILTKSVAGLLPLGVLGLYWICAPAKYRPRFGRVVAAGAAAVTMAAPWFVYQMLAHGRWFWAEHVGVEILGYGAGTPGQTSQENQALFYFTRLAVLDPVLLAIAAAAVPTFVGQLRRRSGAAVLVALGVAMPLTAALVWQYRNVSYLLPMIPLLAILATAYNPLCSGSGRAPTWMMALLAVALVAKVATGSQMWGVPFRAGTQVAVAPALSDYCQRGRGNELLVVDAPDELYASVLPLKARYVLTGSAPTAGKYALDFSSMGIILNEREFDDLPRYLPGFQRELRAWGLGSDEAVGTVVFVGSMGEIERMVAAHPDSDFFLPERYRVAPGAHDEVKVRGDYYLLLSRKAVPGVRRWTCGM